MHFELYQDDAGEWRWRLRSQNGRVIALGDGYKNRSEAVAAIELIRAGAPHAGMQETSV